MQVSHARALTLVGFMSISAGALYADQTTREVGPAEPASRQADLELEPAAASTSQVASFANAMFATNPINDLPVTLATMVQPSTIPDDLTELTTRLHQVAAALPLASDAPRLAQATVEVPLALAAHATLVPAASIGVPWHGRLQNGKRLRAAPNYFIRREARTWGAPHVVTQLERILTDSKLRRLAKHVLAIGDLSANKGGRITEHRSHQSGLDVDLGLFFTTVPEGYPAGFVNANAELDLATTWHLVKQLLATADLPYGVAYIFLDHHVAGRLYAYALSQGEDAATLATWFEFPHGRNSHRGIIRHERNHADHLHVRFKCNPFDTNCRL